MKSLKNYVKRHESIITGKSNLESLYTFKNFPVFMGCVDSSENEDLFADMEWAICPESGIIQLQKLLPLKILYLNQHNDGTGLTWQNMYIKFAEFIRRNNTAKNILEIGGAHDQIAKNYLALDKNAKWTIVEPNPQQINDKRVKVIKSWFDDSFKLTNSIDLIVHSHVFEHIYNPNSFLQSISNFLKAGQRHIFAFPNLLPMLINKFTNCLNFEHTVFLTEYLTDYLLEQNGFKILQKEYYGNPHSIFYATEKRKMVKTNRLINHYLTYKKIFMNFVDYHKQMVKRLNQKIDSSKKTVYLFGAHIFSQYLLNFGLNYKKINSILDNSKAKQGLRLYGTSFIVESPQILNDKGGVYVILKAGIYNEEIKKDILENINPNVKFI